MTDDAPPPSSEPTRPGTPVAKRDSTTRLEFERAVTVLCTRLRAFGDDDARRVLAEGRALAAAFASWAKRPPSDAARNLTFGRTLTFVREAEELLAKRRSGPPSPP